MSDFFPGHITTNCYCSVITEFFLKAKNFNSLHSASFCFKFMNPKKNNEKNIIYLTLKAFYKQRGKIRTFSVLTAINFLLMGLGFATRVKIANILGKNSYGLFAYGLALGSFFSLLIQYGITRTFVRDLIHFPGRTPELIAGSVILRGTIFIFIIIALTLWKVSGFGFQNIPWSPLFVCIATCVIALNMQSFFDVNHQMERVAIYNLIQRCIYFSLVWLIILFYPDMLSIRLLALFLFISGIYYLIIQYRWICPRIFKGKRLNWQVINQEICWILRKNTSIFFASMGGFLVLSLNQLILQQLEGAAALGEYAAVWIIVNLSTSMLSQVYRIGMPVMSKITKNRRKNQRAIAFLIKYTVIMLLLASVISIPVLLFPKLLLGLFFSHEYLSAAPIMRIAAVYMLIYAFASVYSQYLISAHLENRYCINVLIGGGFNIGLSYVLIKQYGSIGAAVSIAIAHSIVSILNFFFTVKHLKETTR